MTDAEIKEVFLSRGFSVKAGCNDLKPYVYEAARALLARARTEAFVGLANTPDDCADQLALTADIMAATARGMGWVAQYCEVCDPERRALLASHAEELAGAATLAESWANAIVAGK